MYQAPRGTSDILPDEQAYWHHVEQKAADACQLYGYQRLDSPVFEEITGVILAGGKSSRYGKNKALVKIQGVSLIKESSG